MRIRFLVSGGAGVGLGHVMRVAALADEARRHGHGVTVVVRGDSAARAALAAELPGAAIEQWQKPEDAVSQASAVVIDSPDDIAAELTSARQRGVRSLVLDRIDHLDHADATVLPVLHGPTLTHPRLFQGADYVTIAPAVRAAGPLPFPGARDIALVTAGGADPLGMTAPLTEALRDTLGDRPHPPAIHVVVGPAFANGDALARRLGGPLTYVHRALARADVAALMARARFALTGFGTSVYDLAFLGTPTVYWTHRTSDLEAARRLHTRGIGACGGSGTALAPETIAQALTETVLEDKWCADASVRSRALVSSADGASALLRLLDDHRASEAS